MYTYLQTIFNSKQSLQDMYAYLQTIFNLKQSLSCTVTVMDPASKHLIARAPSLARMQLVRLLHSLAAGVYYKGTIAGVVPRPEPDAAERAQSEYDPWEAIKVEWDASRGHAAGECEDVSPWEIERDPEDEAVIESDRLAKEAREALSAPPPLPQPVLFQEAPPMPQMQ